MVEKFNKRLHEDLAESAEEELRKNLEGFSKELMGHLPRHSTEIAHHGLNEKATLKYFCKKFFKKI